MDSMRFGSTGAMGLGSCTRDQGDPFRNEPVGAGAAPPDRAAEGGGLEGSCRPERGVCAASASKSLLLDGGGDSKSCTGERRRVSAVRVGPERRATSDRVVDLEDGAIAGT